MQNLKNKSYFEMTKRERKKQRKDMLKYLAKVKFNDPNLVEG